jgi:hypothetical protein
MRKIVNGTSSITTSGKSNGQLKGFAVESLARELWVTNNSKELNGAGRNNSSLALNATSVADSEWELFVTEWFPFLFYNFCWVFNFLKSRVSFKSYSYLV